MLQPTDDALADAQAEIERLRALLVIWRITAEDQKAKIERLTEALQRIAALPHTICRGRDLARDALARREEGK